MASVAVIGAGAVGCYYGALLARTGHDVRFVMRRDLAAVRERGLDIRSVNGNFRIERPAAFGTASEVGEVDWVLCALKATAIDDARELVEPCIGPRTRVVALMNGLGIEERFAEWFGAARMFGGMAFVCINRGEPGVVHHLEYGRLSIGHGEDDAGQLDELRELLESGGIEVTVAPNLRYARWEKLSWNIPFNGMSVAGGGIGTATILADPAMADAVERVMLEVVEAGNVDLAAAGSDARLDADRTVTAMIGQTRTMGDYRTSMCIDYVNGASLEVEAILGEPVRRAHGHGLGVPGMASLYATVRAADLRNRGLIRAFQPEDLAVVEAVRRQA
ncbi:MAG: 2-dehydropantoate 2-reductase [Dehalococcoidia bacterium]